MTLYDVNYSTNGKVRMKNYCHEMASTLKHQDDCFHCGVCENERTHKRKGGDKDEKR